MYHTDAKSKIKYLLLDGVWESTHYWENGE